MKIVFHGANASTFRSGFETKLERKYQLFTVSDFVIEAGEASLFINVGRGPVVDEKALYEALKARMIGGAVIDTWYTYPENDEDIIYPSRYPFHELDNLIATPHMSGWSRGTIDRRQQVMAENIRRLADGDALINIVRGT